jgi:uncharacterized RDD family membrane protein YckC
MAYCPVCGDLEAPGQNFCARCGSPTPSAGARTPGAPAPGGSALPPAPVYRDEAPYQQRVASFWWRVLAFILDQIVVVITVDIVLHSMTSVTFLEGAFISVIVFFLYFGLMVGFARGQTLGMMICHLRVVNATDHGPVTLNQAMARAALYSVLLLVASLYHYTARRTTNMTQKQEEVVVRHGLIWLALAAPHLLDLLWAAWDQRRQTLHDKFAKTVVVRTR